MTVKQIQKKKRSRTKVTNTLTLPEFPGTLKIPSSFSPVKNNYYRDSPTNAK